MSSWPLKGFQVTRANKAKAYAYSGTRQERHVTPLVRYCTLESQHRVANINKSTQPPTQKHTHTEISVYGSEQKEQR